MQDLEECWRHLLNWREEESEKNITSTLKRIFATGSYKYEELVKTAQIVNNFHREIISLEQEKKVDVEWFDNCIKLKKKLKLLQEKMKKAQKEENQKPKSLVSVPQELLQGCNESQKKILAYIFRNFMANLSEKEQKASVKFVKKLYEQIRALYEYKSDMEMNKRIDEVCTSLGKSASTNSKLEMLAGQKSAKQVAANEGEAFIDSERKKLIEENLRQQFESSQTGFYENMKKDISKEACAECVFCHKKAAYVDDMKQTRSADEPMTRFMKCNNCGKNWRDCS